MVPRLAALAVLRSSPYLSGRISERPDVEPISWVPLVWMFLAGSRWVSSWLNLSGPLDSVDDYTEGSPVDRAGLSGR